MNFDSFLHVFLIIFGFGLLIGIHELGHFIAAKWAGIRTHTFAIGMGPTIISWRRGIGICFKSSEVEVRKRFGKSASEMSDEELQQHGLSETEYTLRLLPLGGFVSMLGQEDGKPEAVSNDPRSYNNCAIGKRMVVVSAGVVLNVVLAAVFFLISFQIGVKFEAPVIGQILDGSPASNVRSVDQGIRLDSGDRVLFVNGKKASTFTDIQIAAAMSKPGTPLELTVEKSISGDILDFNILPEKGAQSGLLEIGVYPASSLRLRSGQSSEAVETITSDIFGGSQKIKPGMVMTSVNEQQVQTWSQFDAIVQASSGQSLETQWSDGSRLTVRVRPSFQVLRPTGIPTNAPQNYERGLFGLVPICKVNAVLPSSPNVDSLMSGDLILSVGDTHFPSMGVLRNYLSSLAHEDVQASISRNGVNENVQLKLKGGKLGVMLADAWDSAYLATPLPSVLVKGEEGFVAQDSLFSGKKVKGGCKFYSINGNQINSWDDFRAGLIESAGNASIDFVDQDEEIINIAIELSDSDKVALGNLGWSTGLVDQIFEPVFVTRSSGGNPIQALTMGLEETVDMVVMTYLTIDRLVRRTVGVEQLRGPIGIIHIGSKIADRGFSYLLFFLAIISVNLAVLNFLPLPIVDGGLFLYLVYEKFMGRPPSIAFQNAAAVFGLGLIGMLFIVTFYNDIMRLIG